jgi:transcriptional regulator with XRE-family HTH domain
MDVRDHPTDKTISRAIGEELRRAREASGWSRLQLVARLPSGIGDRTLLSYEHGTRHLSALRLIEICHALGIDAPTLVRRALQRAHIHLENLPLQINLRALMNDKSDIYRPMMQWARNTLNEHPEGVVEVPPVAVRNLALFVGYAYHDLVNYLARFTPDDYYANGGH